jgi:hypothetical protein
MKKNAILPLLLIIFLSCNGENKFYDVEAPKYVFSAQMDDKVLFQFDEPVKELTCDLKTQNSEKETAVFNRFPTANIYMDKDFFKEKGELTMNVKDDFNNCEILKIPMPLINDNPAELAISDIQLKYSEKKPQNFTIKSVKGGNVLGFSVVFYINSDIYEYTFEEETVKTGDSVKLVINPDKTSFQNNINIKFSGKNIKLVPKSRISQSSSLICIKKMGYQIIDYIFFFDSKSHDINYYRNKKNFQSMIYLLNSYDRDPVFTDVKGNSVKKHIIKYKDKFIVNSSG